MARLAWERLGVVAWSALFRLIVRRSLVTGKLVTLYLAGSFDTRGEEYLCCVVLARPRAMAALTVMVVRVSVTIAVIVIIALVVIFVLKS